MTESIYSEFNIDPNKLSRDYLTHPLKRGEKPTKENLSYLYIELNLSRNNLIKMFDWSIDRIKSWIKFYDIKKSKREIIKNTLKTKLDKYGNAVFVNPIKALKTKLKKYGRTDVGQFGTSEHKNVIKEKYGRTNVGQFGTSEHKNAIKEKYGCEYYQETSVFKDKFNDRNWVDVRQQKSYLTKKKNNSFNKSKPEEDYYQKLCEEYGENNVIRQFKSELYPFNCDFYIKSTDTYIEYQGNWTHGKEPYDPSSKEHQALLENWIELDRINPRTLLGQKSYYYFAIKYWTISDPLKRETAKNNGLNFIEIW